MGKSVNTGTGSYTGVQVKVTHLKEIHRVKVDKFLSRSTLVASRSQG